MRTNLLLAGAGHAHMETLVHLDAFSDLGYRAAVIGPSAYHYYSGMGPGMLGGFYRPDEIRFNVKQMVENRGGTFICGRVSAIDAQNRLVRLESGDEITYDVLSCNLGSQVPRDLIQGSMDDVFPVKPIEGLVKARERILELGARKPITVGIIGGGPSAVEIAGNLDRLCHIEDVRPLRIAILSKQALLDGFPLGVRSRARSALKRRGIALIEGCEIDKIQSGAVIDRSGEIHEYDIIFVAVGVKPTPVFTQSGIPSGPEGGLRVNRFLQSSAFPNLFGGGDCIYFEDLPLDKVGVYAVRENSVLFHNLIAALGKNPLRAFNPGGGYLLIFNMGDKTGIFHKGGISFEGRTAFLIKDYLDRKFMRRYPSGP